MHNEIQGDVIGEVWRAQEGAKEITYFLVRGGRQLVQDRVHWTVHG